jgi:hypothetical protein
MHNIYLASTLACVAARNLSALPTSARWRAQIYLGYLVMKILLGHPTPWTAEIVTAGLCGFYHGIGPRLDRVRGRLMHRRRAHLAEIWSRGLQSDD